MKTVFVGMSGGVDSSVTASLLKEQGYSVVGVFMKNWTKDLPGFDCPWQEDYQDAKRVAVQLGIEFKVFDFEKQYRQKVVDYMIAEYKAGRTPNPDIMCNQEIKFKLFLETALEEGADMIATGHYAQVKDGLLYKAKDSSKDQTYFLYRVTKKSLLKTLFPLGIYTKTEVRKLAKELNLVTATKKDSMGICFVGKVGIKEFLEAELGTQQFGNIIDESGRIVGQHEGAIFYTIGQRHGLNVGGGLPYYVIGKDISKNEVYVTTNLASTKLWNKSINLNQVHWINGVPKDLEVDVRTRHGAQLVEGKIILSSKISSKSSHSKIEISLKNEIRALTSGQSAVLYQGNKVLGGGIIL